MKKFKIKLSSDFTKNTLRQYRKVHQSTIDALSKHNELHTRFVVGIALVLGILLSFPLAALVKFLFKLFF